MRAVLYARVSGDDRNRTGGANLADQLALCRKHATEHGYTVTAELAEDDHGASGATFDLPQLSEALALAHNGSFDVLIVRELDRLSRNLAKQLIVEQELKRAGVKIEYVLYDFPDTPEGTLNKHLRAMLAEYERAKIGQRMVRGRNRIASNGMLILHGRAAPYGYRRVDAEGPTTLEIDESQAATVRDIYRWYIEGDSTQGPMSTPTIANQLTKLGVPTWADIHRADHMRKVRPPKVWCASSISKILKNELYTGTWRYGANNIAVNVPAIIDRELFEMARRKAKGNIWKARRNTKNEYLMQHRLTCATCGHALGVKTNNGRTPVQRYYVCRIARNDKTLNCENRRHYNATRLDATIWAWLRGLLTDQEELERSLHQYQREREKIIAPVKRRLAAIDDTIAITRAKLHRILDLYVNGGWEREELEQRRNQYNAQLRELEARRVEASQEIEAEGFDEQRMESILEFARGISVGLEEADVDFERRRQLVDLLDVTGVVGNDEKGDWVMVRLVMGEEKLSIANQSSSFLAKPATPAARRRQASAPSTPSS